jgi:2-(1,2-epoxy-1,2-dihydrophenyl)acetyl-CoA isomerase
MTEIDVTRAEPRATVTIRKPQRRNAIDGAAASDLASVLRTLGADESIRAVVLTGAGDHFCSGIDLTGGFEGDDVPTELATGLHAVARALVRAPKPTVARVRGSAAGAGAAIATACDFVYAEETAAFGWEFTDIGLAPDTGATYVLPRLVGTRRALDLLATGRRIDAATAAEWGIATEAVPADEFDAVVDERVASLAARPTRAVGELKRLVRRNSHRSLEEALRAEARAQDRLVRTDDFAAGVTAFFADRDPAFEGR